MGTALLSIGVRAMAASYAQMQTTGHNIANASVEGYSRQQVNLATARGQYTGVGYFGRGVDVVGVQRMQDQFLTNEAARSKSLASMDAVRSARLQQLQEAFKGGEQGIGASITNLFAAYSDLASRPTDGASRGVVLARAQDVARRFNTAGEQMATLQTTVNQELQAAVTAVNTIAASIAKVNNDVAAARGSGQMPNDLLDQRDRLISQLSEYVSVSTIEADDGTLGVFMGGGQRLVLGVQAERLEVTPDTFDGSRKSVTISEGAVQRSLTADSLGGGSIPGLLKFQNEDLVSAQSMLGQLARALAGAVNEPAGAGPGPGGPLRPEAVRLRPQHAGPAGPAGQHQRGDGPGVGRGHARRRTAGPRVRAAHRRHRPQQGPAGPRARRRHRDQRRRRCRGARRRLRDPFRLGHHPGRPLPPAAHRPGGDGHAREHQQPGRPGRGLAAGGRRRPAPTPAP
jgi:flagellar hook-associated protein 1 FlgK